MWYHFYFAISLARLMLGVLWCLAPWWPHHTRALLWLMRHKPLKELTVLCSDHQNKKQVGGK